MFWDELIRAVAGTFFGAVGFAMLVHVPKRSLLASSLIATLSYVVYWGFLQLGFSEWSSVFMGSFCGSLAGLLCARRMKIIGTVFLMSAVVPVVPGLGLYRTMASLGQGRTTQGANQGIQAMIVIAMTALGLVLGSFLDRQIHDRKH
jgi:uncharacterized membrane protein YjjB (DUF3815 family)